MHKNEGIFGKFFKNLFGASTTNEAIKDESVSKTGDKNGSSANTSPHAVSKKTGKKTGKKKVGTYVTPDGRRYVYLSDMCKALGINKKLYDKYTDPSRHLTYAEAISAAQAEMNLIKNANTEGKTLEDVIISSVKNSTEKENSTPQLNIDNLKVNEEITSDLNSDSTEASSISESVVSELKELFPIEESSKTALTNDIADDKKEPTKEINKQPETKSPSSRRGGKRKPVCDLEGRHFDTIKDLCEYHNLPYKLTVRRLEDGWSLERIISNPANYNSGRCKSVCDLEGRKFNSIKSLCDYHNLPYKLITRRLAEGWGVERAISEPINEKYSNKKATKNKKEVVSKQNTLEPRIVFNPKKGESKICIDHKGNIYPSAQAICKAYGIKKYTADYRIKVLGWSVEEALTTPEGLNEKPQKITNNTSKEPHDLKKDNFSNNSTPSNDGLPHIDHEGKVFSNAKEMCDYWQIPYETFKDRIENLKWDVEKSLITPIKISSKSNNEESAKSQVTDCLGNKFCTTEEMCNHWNITLEHFNKEAAKERKLKDILFDGGYTEAEITIDHRGYKFPSPSAMCQFYKIGTKEYQVKLHNGIPLEEILCGIRRENNEKNDPILGEYEQLELDLDKNKKVWLDYQGHSFPTKKAMCKYHNISTSTYDYRIRSGFTPEQALKLKINRGNVYEKIKNDPSIKEEK